MWIPLMSFFMGLLAFGLSRTIHAILTTSKVPKDMQEWHGEVENACFDVIRSRIYVAECEKRIIDLVGEVPMDFNPTLFAAPHLAKVMEDALIKQAQSKDIWPEKRFDHPAPLPDNVVSLDNHEWVAGQLLKKVGT
jgi:hypothetical protein